LGEEALELGECLVSILQLGELLDSLEQLEKGDSLFAQSGYETT
jgi:hypothetical protein